MMAPKIALSPGTLWPAIVQRTRHALANQALRPIETAERVIDDGGVRFLVRSVASLKHKPKDSAPVRSHEAPPRNPFLPYEQDLFVADVSPTHVALLNKFPVLAHHLLIVTRAYEPQEALLTPEDFQALAACMEQMHGLAFYNGGSEAGASQPHKHLQIVPLPLSRDGAPVPIEPLLACAPADARPDRVPGLPFLHSFVRLNSALFNKLDVAAEVLAQYYRALRDATGVGAQLEAGTAHQTVPYNLLLTREWMLLVPRAGELAAGISVNALGFAGSLFVNTPEQVEQVERIGPMGMLRQVTMP